MATGSTITEPYCDPGIATKSEATRFRIACSHTIRAFVISAIFLIAFSPATLQADDSVEQPIQFPHKRHAAPVEDDGYGINCLYCHSYARRSAVAGIPPLAKCMGCHRYIATDKDEIVKLTEYWQSGKTVPWKKVHDLPDFVFFTHERHIQRFVFQEGQPVQQVCGYCHGDVKTMTVADRKRPLTMGWCISCHEQFEDPSVHTPSPNEDWKIAASDKALMSEVQVTQLQSLKRNPAPNDCWECHK